MSLSRFESRFIRLQKDYPTGMTAPAVLQRALAMLADLAADTLETDADRARDMLASSSGRIERLFRNWPDVSVPLAAWRRDVTLYPAEDGKALRCRAIREAERLMRALPDEILDEIVDDHAGEDGYRSSSMSQ